VPDGTVYRGGSTRQFAPHGAAEQPADAQKREKEPGTSGSPDLLDGFHLVRPAQSAHPRRRHGSAHEGSLSGSTPKHMAYAVRLGAWTCTCAAFAFSAFSATATVAGPGLDGNFTSTEGGSGHREQGSGMDLNGDDQEAGRESVPDRKKGKQTEEAVAGGARENAMGEQSGAWSFGGMSLDGTEAGTSESVPICKHLLACLLAERWKPALGRYVSERRLRKEEMAGIVAEL
jgi:hypothetical protein